jgi:hypothetical protein
MLSITDNLDTTRKSAPLSPKKKRRKYNSDNNNSPNESLTSVGSIMDLSENRHCIKLIDRTVNVGKYRNDAGLYELAREWLNSKDTFSDSDKVYNKIEQNDDGQFVFKLPDPEPDLNAQLNIQVLNEKIKENIRSSEKNDLVIIEHLNQTDQTIQTHALLKLHLNRWRATRNQWIQFYNIKNKPYNNSLRELKSIYEGL